MSETPPSSEGPITGSPDALEEDVDVEQGLPEVVKVREARKTKREQTRKAMAFWLIAILAGLATVGAVGWLRDGGDTERMQNFAILFSPVTTLIGTVLGFYYSSSSHE